MADTVAEAVRLVNESGLSIAAAAHEAGCSYSGVWKRLHPERAREWGRRDNARRAPQKRAWEDAQRASCPHCGRLSGAGTLRADGSRRHAGDGTCPACQHVLLVERLREMVRLRRDLDLSNSEIAERLGLPSLTVSTRLKECRALGVDVPYDPYNRPPPGTRKHVAQAHTVQPWMVLAIREAFPEVATNGDSAMTRKERSGD